MSASNKIIQAAAGNVAGGAVEPVGIDFDGTNDYLSRSSDLVGATDGKTFTFSAWVYISGSGATQRIYHSDDGTGWPRFSVLVNSGSSVTFASYPTDGTARLNITSAANSLSKNTWHHILASVDMASQANSKIYINDENVTFAVSTFTDTNLSFSNTAHKIGAETPSAGRVEGRLAGVYLDYTYRDLSVEANRRDFIDENGLYVTPPTSGIISVPMDDPDDPGRNDGTGGDFTLNGVVAQSGRGPNQYNAAASRFDGSNDQLSSNGLGSITNGKTLTFCATFDIETYTTHYPVDTGASAPIYQPFRWGLLSDGRFSVAARDSAYPFRFLSTETIPLNQMNFLQVSVDVSDTNKRHVLLNNRAVAGTWSQYNDGNIRLNEITSAYIGKPASGNAHDGALGEIWLSQDYIDLETDNPFWDSDTGKPKPVRQVLEETGNTPLIAMPIRADDAGNNLGTGGDFTVNSGPYVGARGPSEFWGESAEFDGTSSNYLRRGAISGASNGKAFTLVFAHKTDVDSSDIIFEISDGTYNNLRVINDSFERFIISATNAAGTDILDISSTTSDLVAGSWYMTLISVDLTDANKRHLYIDGVSDLASVSTYTNDTINLTSSQVSIGADYNGGTAIDGKIGFFWFNTEYVDFSQEANRLKFFDAFNNPVDLGEDGSTPTGSQPLIYMNSGFNSGTNLGSGGDFTVIGTVNDGGYVNG